MQLKKSWPTLLALTIVGLMLFAAITDQKNSTNPPPPTNTKPATSHPLYYYSDKSGARVLVEHVMGQEPFQTPVRMVATGQATVIDDDVLYRNIQYAVSRMGEPYQSQWQGYLNQTTLRPDDPERNFFIEVANESAAEIGPCAFQALERNGLLIKVRSDFSLDPDWSAVDSILQALIISGLIHEMRHLEDFVNNHDLLFASTEEMVAKANSRKKDFTEDDFRTVIAYASETVASEMLAFSRQYGWIKKNCSGVLPAISTNPEEGPRWEAWASGDARKFAEAIYASYKLIIWGQVPLSRVDDLLGETNEQIIINVALTAYQKARPDPVE
ncbi:MAG: hypothetical protein V1826_02850 [bacterium]